MQIWVMSGDPGRSVLLLDDKRIVKMVLETTQILTTALALRGTTKGLPVKPTHENHPCVRWAAESSDNFWWLLTQLEAYHYQYTMRVSQKIFKEHVYLQHLPFFAGAYNDMPAEAPTPFVNCTDQEDECVHQAYCKYLINKWRNDILEPRFTGTIFPAEIREKRVLDVMRVVSTAVVHKRP